ncbi:MAG TPA: PolC-type DNA polymerase III N-terminal domain-containing protein, partial [Lachnospiraceae bacterium]|nr:PolC-type DNA polymerase III N-terminal domain-containing protein [Lachnospiraceae bacterium]
MAMQFFEVFDTLTVTRELRELFEDTIVERVTASREQHEVKVFIVSTHLISREQVKRMEYQVSKQLFEGTSNRIYIIDRYELSAQYTSENLLNMYFDSFLEELRESSILEYNLFRLAEFAFSEDKLLLRLEDNFLAKSKALNMKGILEDIFHNRFGSKIQIQFEYYEPIEKEEVTSDAKSSTRQMQSQNSSEYEDQIAATCEELPFTEDVVLKDRSSAQTGKSEKKEEKEVSKGNTKE